MPGNKPRGKTTKAKPAPKKKPAAPKRTNTCSGGACGRPKVACKPVGRQSKCYGGRCYSSSSYSSSCGSDCSSSYDSDSYSSDEPCCRRGRCCR